MVLQGASYVLVPSTLAVILGIHEPAMCRISQEESPNPG